jgi:hypothetical protein
VSDQHLSARRNDMAHEALFHNVIVTLDGLARTAPDDWEDTRYNDCNCPGCGRSVTCVSRPLKSIHGLRRVSRWLKTHTEALKKPCFKALKGKSVNSTIRSMRSHMRECCECGDSEDARYILTMEWFPYLRTPSDMKELEKEVPAFCELVIPPRPGHSAPGPAAAAATGPPQQGGPTASPQWVTEQELRRMFQTYDKDGSGRVSGGSCPGAWACAATCCCT